jgi:hypothetical protein
MTFPLTEISPWEKEFPISIRIQESTPDTKHLPSMDQQTTKSTKTKI